MSDEKVSNAGHDEHSSIDKEKGDVHVVSRSAALTGEDEVQAFTRKDVSWTKEEERALVTKLGQFDYLPLVQN